MLRADVLLPCSVEEFHRQADPDRENLCLYGTNDGNWVVDLPAEEVPPEVPEPALGINFARDGMQVRHSGQVFAQWRGHTVRLFPKQRFISGLSEHHLWLFFPACMLKSPVLKSLNRKGPKLTLPCLQRRDWLALVAVHSDTWLVSVAFYYGARLHREGR